MRSTRRCAHDGFPIVLLARLSPLIPYNLLNYGLSITAVRFRDYLLATWIGMLPAIVLYVYTGSLANSLRPDERRPRPELGGAFVARDRFCGDGRAHGC